MSKHITLSLTALAFALAAGPALAGPMCNDATPGIQLSFGVSVGEKFSESDRNEFDLQRLRAKGVDATSVERWGSCIRAYVRKPEGGIEMQFFDPNSYRRVE